MQGSKVVLLAALGGGIFGALFTQLDLHAVKGLSFFARDSELLNHRGFLLAAMGTWAVFGLYWEHAAKKASEAKSSESGASRGLHVFLVNAAILLEIAPIRGLGRFIPVLPVVMTLGLVVETAGLALAVWARQHLGRHWSGRIAIKVEHQLIKSGPYRLLRHPIYTGLLAVYAGPMLVTGEWLAVIGFAMAFFAYWRKIRLEEATLGVAFGQDYAAYRRETWALVPGLF